MAQKKKKKRSENDYQEKDYDDVLKGKAPVTVFELIKMIHRINPTGADLGSKESSERYKIKTRLQSLLIRRFNESLMVEQPEPGNPRLVGLRLRHFDLDACHAMIDELEEDARSWTQRQIDQGLTSQPSESAETSKKALHYGSPGSVENSPSGGITESEKNLTKDELIKLGQNALAEYDYDACEKFYRRALEVSGDDPAPALLLLELYVDYLAAYEKALDLSKTLPLTLPLSVRINDKMRVFSALAAARSGQIDDALEYIKRLSHPDASEVYLLSAKHFIQVGDLARASTLFGELTSFEQAGLKPEIDQLAKDIQSLRAKSLEPLEREMILAQQQGRTEASLKLADRILSLSPENRAAQRIRQEFIQQQRDEEINQLLGLADEARKNNDFSREAALLNKAIAGGAKAEELAARLAYALTEAKRQKEEMEIHSISNFLTEGNKKKAFLQYVNLNAQQRGRINDQIHDPHLVWLDEILARQTAAKPEKMVEAVLALGKAKEAIKAKKEPERIMAELEPHGKVLQSVPEAQDLRQQAERLSQAVKSTEANDLLHRAAGFLEMEDLQKARICLDQVKINFLQKDDKKLFDEINHKLSYLEKVMRLKQKYAVSHDRRDHFAARAMAGELAGHMGPDTSGYWLDRLEEHTSCIKKEWVLVSIDIDELPIYYAAVGLSWLDEIIYSCLLPDQRHLIIATSQERWVFLRIFCLDDQKFKKAIILRAPKQMFLHNVYPVGNVLWITGENGEVLELGLEPLNILSWHDFSSFAGEDEVIEGAWLFPKSKSLWLDKRPKNSDFSELCEIIDIDRQSIVRQMKVSGFPIAINTGSNFRIALQNFETKTVQVYSERGKAVESFAFKDCQLIDVVTLHPNGKDFVFLPHDSQDSMESDEEVEGEQDGGLVLTIEVRPDLPGKHKPLRIENSNGEFSHTMFTSLDTGILFIRYKDVFSEVSEYILAAFKETGQGFQRLYEIRVPKRVVLACDELSRNVAAINFQGNRIEAVVLNENPPVFDFEIPGPSNKVIPEFRCDFFLCHNPTGIIKATALAYMLEIQSWKEKELNQTINKIKQPGTHTSDEIAAFIYALYQSSFFEKSKDLKLWMRNQHPTHYSVLLDLAEEAAEGKNWLQVISLLEGIGRPDLNHGTARHICHLLGIAYFIQGEIQKARNVWMEGITYEDGKCDLNPYVEYAELSLMTAEERHKQKSDMAKALNTFEAVDNHLANNRWGKAIETIEKSVDLSQTDLQLLSRLAWAYLQQNFNPGDIPWLFKIITLGNYCEVYNKKYMYANKVLPPYIERWTESRLSDLAGQAKQWLDRL